MARKWTHIVIHHSLTKDNETVSWQAIRKYHTKTLGWQDIGYHFGLEKVNDEYEVLIGRLLTQHGAHCIGLNQQGIGICCVGNYDEIMPDWEMIKKLRDFCKWLMEVYDIPVENVIGHGEYCHYKTCPGVMFDMNWFRELLK